LDLIGKFSNTRILIIGDVILDRYIYGNVSRISPEAPVPILNKTRDSYYLGGSGNVLSNIKSLCGNSDILSVIGDDSCGDIVSDLVNEVSKNSFIYREANRKTTLKSRYISGSHQMLRVDEETTHYISDVTENILISKLESMVGNYECVILEDYNKGLLTPRFIREVIRQCNSLSIPVIVDPKTMNIADYANCKLIKPNLFEFIQMSGYDNNTFDINRLKTEARKFIKSNSIDSILITLSERGLLYVDPLLDIHDPGYPVDISDVSGAGDTVISMLSLCISSGIDIKKSLSLCNISASIACSSSGIISVKLDDVINSKFYTQ
jgi:rfaE bifunctional protein kinase chain/domain